MGFILRYVMSVMTAAVKTIWKILLAITIINCIVAAAVVLADKDSHVLVIYLKFMIIPLLQGFILGAAAIAITLIPKYSVYKIRDEKGFCLEYFYAYEYKFIKGKSKNNADYIEFAEIYQQLGDYKSALAVLDSLKIPESDISLRISFIFVYMNTAIAMGNSALADDIWRKNQQFISERKKKFIYKRSYEGLDLMTATADCLAGRYERALQTCNVLIETGDSDYTASFYILLVYLYKMLNNENMYRIAVENAKSKIDRSRPVFESIKSELYRDLEKAMKGELP